MYDFAYQKPTSLADAVKALGSADAKAMAGGMSSSALAIGPG